MFDIAEFHIVGRVGTIKKFDKLTRISIAANASYKKDGAWVDKTHWNEVVIFDGATRDYIAEKFTKGDYVRARGSVRQNSYMRGTEQVYTTELIIEQISRMPVKRADNPDAEPAPEPAKRQTKARVKASAPASTYDDDIPF